MLEVPLPSDADATESDFVAWGYGRTPSQHGTGNDTGKPDSRGKKSSGSNEKITTISLVVSRHC